MMFLSLHNLVPEYVNYWFVVGLPKFIRVFWYFVIFEFTRYIIIDYIIAFIFFITGKKRAKKFEEAKRKLFQENPFVSVIIPGKNEGKHLYKLTKSLAEQTFKNFELIIVDDGSDDDTPIIGKNLERLGLIDMFIRNEMRGGKASAANLALRFSKGKYIVHLDADCSFDSDAIEQVLLPFFVNDKIAAVGGNVKVRNYKESLCAKLQAIEYLKTVSVGRIITSYLGIYKIISGAFGAFRKDVIDNIGGWDIGPGLDGDITVKIRKSGYKVYFQEKAICLTNAPSKFKVLTKQRLRWDKSIIRFRVRKHKDVYLPTANFNCSTFFSLAENVFYNVILDIMWWVYIIDIIVNYNSSLKFIIPMNFTLYFVMSYVQMLSIYIFSERREEEKYLWPYVILMTIYTGTYLRIVRTIAYYKEFFFKRSFEDPWNPYKSSIQAKRAGL
ncbi:cellulose synthase/poly-beta-1,6-N-acetylglucosamine synthase-like glycosyltransferase [Tenacibaculum gallaicum]|uniref:Cellulose synthase/poly-beta-1,6-N-acetylglucosamine synthase-like glycosyltransferase n=1 Tax=Tenacibaculum gallaicum TaxID=561505 RepID=A0A3E0HFB2_9FLAO|nr:glycosyltransferase [Tenacibaculum gallaicum]REH44495.1 cellulose synthase/poly-beta-1,6-N-acetylglucosamine synthase-like glycosyltransferase [Tenacibaculum gallaicum]